MGRFAFSAKLGDLGRQEGEVSVDVGGIKILWVTWVRLSREGVRMFKIYSGHV